MGADKWTRQRAFPDDAERHEGRLHETVRQAPASSATATASHGSIRSQSAGSTLDLANAGWQDRRSSTPKHCEQVQANNFAENAALSRPLTKTWSAFPRATSRTSSLCARLPSTSRSRPNRSRSEFGVGNQRSSSAG